MWPFGKRAPTDTPTPAPQPAGGAERYATAPFNLFFEGYVLDIIGELSPFDDERFEKMNLQRVFKTRASAWRDVVHEVMHLSDTFEIAVLDLWFRNRAASLAQAPQNAPRLFAQLFVDNFLAPDSRVDQWPPGTLDAAKARIAANGGKPQKKWG